MAAIIDVVIYSTARPRVVGFAAIAKEECFTVGFGIGIDLDLPSLKAYCLAFGLIYR